MLHRSCVDEFKGLRQTVFVLGAQKKAEAFEVGTALTDEVVQELCKVQGIE